MSASVAAPATPHFGAGSTRRRRALLWGALVALLAVAQTMLVWLTLNYESSRAQEQVELVSAGVASDLKQTLSRDLQSLQALLWNDPTPMQWRAESTDLLRSHREIVRIERRDTEHRIVDAVESPYQTALFTRIKREEIDLDTEVACSTAVRQASPIFSRSYFVPLPGGLGLEVMDVCLPVQEAGLLRGFLAATFALSGVLAESVAPEVLRHHELSFIEGDGTRLARVGLMRGAGVYRSERLIDLPGATLQFRIDSSAGSPQLIPNLAVALVLGLSLALGGVVALLVRDVRKRASAERALAESLAFRKAMEDSLVTGLRARDLEGRVTYVNPAFCQMVGFSAEEMIGRTTPPYWPPELAPEYARRQALRLSSKASSERARQAREGFETTFERRNGERFAVLIFEAPLVDGTGRHTGWMSAVLDVSDQRRMEEISRQQQERLQATARLATVGEMASLLSHELNQPLAAIASYAAGSLNLMQSGAHDADTAAMLKQAAERIAEQAERAGRVIKSVHNFVRRREQVHEAVRADVLIEAVLPLVRLQARKSGTRVEVDIPTPMPRVVCDRTMVEQVLLNLTRNGIQAMEGHNTPADLRELHIRVRQNHPRWVTFSVVDHGPGVPPEVAQRLFTPFFTTRQEGMGLGLSLCRTVIEQHGGALDFGSLPSAEGTGARTEFRFTLPADTADRRAAAHSGPQPTHTAPTTP